MVRPSFVLPRAGPPELSRRSGFTSKAGQKESGNREGARFAERDGATVLPFTGRLLTVAAVMPRRRATPVPSLIVRSPQPPYDAIVIGTGHPAPRPRAVAAGMKVAIEQGRFAAPAVNMLHSPEDSGCQAYAALSPAARTSTGWKSGAGQWT